MFERAHRCGIDERVLCCGQSAGTRTCRQRRAAHTQPRTAHGTRIHTCTPRSEATQGCAFIRGATQQGGRHRTEQQKQIRPQRINSRALHSTHPHMHHTPTGEQERHWAVSCSKDMSVRVWDTRTGRSVRVSYVMAVNFGALICMGCPIRACVAV